MQISTPIILPEDGVKILGTKWRMGRWDSNIFLLIYI